MGISYAEVIGDPIAHSKSPLIHKFWLKKLGIEGDYRACRVPSDKLEDYFTTRLEAENWRGCNVTMPHKEAVLKFVDEARLGLLDAANTIVPRAGGLVALNTDVLGILEPLSAYPLPAEEVSSLDPSARAAIAQIVGAGGAAQAAIDAAGDAGYHHIEIYSRDLERAREAAARASFSRRQAFSLADLSYAPMKPGHPYEGYECRYLIINASPMGMEGQPGVPIDLSRYPATTIVFDMVYTPIETPLLKAAREYGLVTIDGLQMLVAQAAAAFELFFGVSAPRAHDAELRELLTR